MSATKTGDLRSQGNHDFAALLTGNRQIAMKLPEPGDSWALSETNLTRSEHGKLRCVGAIEHAEREQLVDHSGHVYSRWRWETNSSVYEWIERYFDEDVAECPADDCRSTGIRCLEAGERYTCSNAECSEQFGRETAQELIGR